MLVFTKYFYNHDRIIIILSFSTALIDGSKASIYLHIALSNFCVKKVSPMKFVWNATYAFTKPKPFIFQAMSNSTHFEYANKLYKNAINAWNF